MKLYIKQKMFSFTDSYDIYDENQNIKYFAKCDFTWMLHRLRIYENSQQIGFVEEHFKWVEPEFSLYLNNQKYGRIIKELTFFKPRYYLDFNDWQIRGNFWGLDYEVINPKGMVIMKFYKELFTWTDHYCLDILDESNEKICVLIALAVDMAVCSQSN